MNYICCLNTKRDLNEAFDIINNIAGLEDYEKRILSTRFRKIYGYTRNKYSIISFLYNVSKIFIIITGIINPALLSISDKDVNNNNTHFSHFWLIWFLQLLSSLVSSCSSFFKWDKKHFVYQTYKKKLEREIWSYVELIDKYSITDETNDIETGLGYSTHKTKYKTFINRIENLYVQLHRTDAEINTIDDDPKKAVKPSSTLQKINSGDLSFASPTRNNQTNLSSSEDDFAFRQETPRKKHYKNKPLFANMSIKDKMMSNKTNQLREQCIQLQNCVDKAIYLHHEIQLFEQEGNHEDSISFSKKNLNELNRECISFIDHLINDKHLPEVEECFFNVKKNLKENELWIDLIGKIEQDSFANTTRQSLSFPHRPNIPKLNLNVNTDQI